MLRVEVDNRGGPRRRAMMEEVMDENGRGGRERKTVRFEGVGDEDGGRERGDGRMGARADEPEREARMDRVETWRMPRYGPPPRRRERVEEEEWEDVRVSPIRPVRGMDNQRPLSRSRMLLTSDGYSSS